MKQYFTVGEMASLFDLNPKTLRFYDEIDLFKPEIINPENNYRYYSMDQIDQLETIEYLKDLGLSLKVIKYHLEEVNIDNVINSLVYQREITCKKIKELQSIKYKIDKKIKQIEDAINTENINEVVELDLEARKIVRLKGKNISYEDIGIYVRKLVKESREKVSLSYGNVGLFIDKDNFENGRYNQYDGVFAIIDKTKYDRRLLKKLPKGKYLRIRFNGYHKDAPAYYDKIKKYIEDNDYIILDDPFEIQIVDPTLIQKEDDMITEIQVLVDKNEK